jgi:hypothetical protein
MCPSNGLLQSYVDCRDDQAADELLGRLLFDEAEPLVRGVFGRRLRGVASPQDCEDLTAELILDLIVRLRRDRLATGGRAVANFYSYAATAAHHACDRFFRSRYPLRHRLKNRLRYVLGEDPRFAIWTDGRGITVCGWAAWKGQPPGTLVGGRAAISPSIPLEVALEDLLEAAGKPLELDELTDALYETWAIRDVESPGHLAGGHPAAGLEAAIDNRRQLDRLWTEILLLPAAHRTALLLHLRDHQSGPILALFPASGVASIDQVAAALEMPVEELAELWDRLPLDDSEIGLRLQMKPQKVINLRSAARHRLARRARTPLKRAEEA